VLVVVLVVGVGGGRDSCDVATGVEGRASCVPEGTGTPEVVVKVISIVVDVVEKKAGGNKPGGGLIGGCSGVGLIGGCSGAGVGEVPGEMLNAAAKF
jgi:hypothetical protein